MTDYYYSAINTGTATTITSSTGFIYANYTAANMVIKCAIRGCNYNTYLNYGYCVDCLAKAETKARQGRLFKNVSR